ncbi:hypothetical protein TCAL_04473 [Tigriopus californicus]|uniref:Solute carrier organic anion transporter family member n=2 Tax=Tigriopus californicus TaxID=6832 RepID=A0A553NWZ7_TIGCA|nr:hypothetical protein TCAL_04473 [Tigriopus californicus]|eukprot:TCALIF_04473-PA protein Name:"Similar to SLCO5A1 Solute carrier organic anion transporter family member 5A1 (Homo sapiens)" AED:0.02 eAED:0.02 QI:0/-1/0/1/-1/1/1/0/687
MVLYGILVIIQSMLFTYLSATLSTLEKKFGIKSKEAAYIMSGNEISQFLFIFALPFIVKAKRRPLWTSLGLVCTGIGCFLMALPHWLSPVAEVLELEELEFQRNHSSTAGLCGSVYHPASLEGSCDAEGNRNIDLVGLIIVFIGIVLTGIGNCVFWSFGIAYLDDNSGHGNSPIMLSITYTFRLLGPTLGFLLASFCLKTFVNPGVDPGYDETDPRWVGAWWLGYPIIGALILVFAFPLAFFPQRLPKEGTDADRKEKEDLMKSGLNEFMNTNSFRASIMRLLKNKLFMYNFFSSIFYAFAFMGFGTFMPKYIEFQFRITGSNSSTYAGGIGTGSKAMGLLISGFLIAKFKPSARFLSGYSVVLGLIFFGVLIAISTLGCPTSMVHGTMGENGIIDIKSSCNNECECPSSRLEPICSKDGTTNFYSPCQAGCLSKRSFTPNKKEGDEEDPKDTLVFEDCSCVQEAWNQSNFKYSRDWILNDFFPGQEHITDDLITAKMEEVDPIPIDSAFKGWCPVDCGNVFATFGITMFVVMILGSTGRIGNMLVALRCIEIRDKSLSVAFNVIFLSLLAMLPGPVVYGFLIDNICILWQEECGEPTNCLLYDSDQLRLVLMLTTAGIMFIGVLFDIGVWYHSKGLVIFYEEEDTKSSSNEVRHDSKDDVQTMERYASSLSINASCKNALAAGPTH